MQKLVRSSDPGAERYRDRLRQSAAAFEAAASAAGGDAARRELAADAAARRTAIEATLDPCWMTDSEALERAMNYLDRNDPTPTY